MRLHRLLPFGVLWLFSGAAAGTAIGGEPRPPCGGSAPLPAFAPPGATPSVAVWRGADITDAWSPSAECGVVWTRNVRPGLVVALAGTFRHEGDADALLGRVGRISGLTGARYWSTTDGAWRPLATQATAWSEGDPPHRRPDFSAAELRSGRDFRFAQRDGRSTGDVVYRLHVASSDPRRLVAVVENLSPVRLLLLTLFAPGDLRSAYFIQPVAPGIWGFYALLLVHVAGPLGGGTRHPTSTALSPCSASLRASRRTRNRRRWCGDPHGHARRRPRAKMWRQVAGGRAKACAGLGSGRLSPGYVGRGGNPQSAR